MKVEIINPFIEASKNIINQVSNLEVDIGKVYLKTEANKSNNIIVFVGLTGKIYGNAALFFKPSIACKIASAMMGGYQFEELDEMSKSAVSELGNMILGNTATLLSKLDILIDISPPTLVVGNNLLISTDKAETICIPLIIDNEECITLAISYKEKN